MPDPQPAASATTHRVRADIARVAGLMFARGLTDAAGGNLSVRVAADEGWHMCMTPRYAGHARHWRLAAEDVLELDAECRVREGDGESSRDAPLHAAVYRALPAAGAVVHAHAPHCLVYAAAGRTLMPWIEAARPIGPVPVVPGGADEARAVAAALAARAAAVAAFAAAVLVAGHGIVVAGRDLAHAYDGLERLEANARTSLWAASLPPEVNVGASGAVS